MGRVRRRSVLSWLDTCSNISCNRKGRYSVQFGLALESFRDTQSGGSLIVLALLPIRQFSKYSRWRCGVGSVGGGGEEMREQWIHSFARVDKLRNECCVSRLHVATVA